MKKLISFVLATALVLSCCAGASADSAGLFRGINILPELLERAHTDYVRRDEFSAVAAALMGFTTVQPSATPFSDVKEDNIYGSSIRSVREAGVMNGVSSTEFAPQSTITFRDAMVTYIRILGYSIWADSKGGYPVGYNNVAASLKLFNRISQPQDSMLTFGDLWALTDWVLETPTAESNFSVSDGIISEEIVVNQNSPTLIEKNLGYTMYEAHVDEIMGDSHSIQVTITEDDKRGNAKYSEGDTLIIKAAANVNIAAYDKTPVYIWISDRDELIHISVQENCDVIYAPVYSVNRDYNNKTSYNTANIYEMAFWDIDKEFDIHEDGADFYENDTKVTGKIALTDKFVRAVIKDNKIVSVETWNIKNGGIVSEVNFKNVVYKRGDTTEAISNLQDFKKQIVILDGEMRDIKELKPGTLVDYYMSGDRETLVLLASSRKHTDVFEAVTEDEIQLGKLLLKTADTVYTLSVDRGYYVEGSASEFIGNDVTVYVDSFGKVRYITTQDTASKNNFIGYLIGIKEGTGLDSQKEISVVNLDDNSFVHKVYKVSDRLDESEVSYAELTESQNHKNAKSIFRFKFNGKDEIVKVTKLNPYFGYEPDSDGLVAFSWKEQYQEKGDPTWCEIGGKKLYFGKNERIVVIYEKDGEVAFGVTTYGELERKHPSTTVTFAFFGGYMSAEFDLILLSGDIPKMSSESRSFGVISSVRTGADSEGNKTTIAEIDSKKYVVNPEDVAGLKENTVVYYTETTGGFSDYDIDIRDRVSLDGDFFEWEGMSGPNGDITLHRGNVAKIDSKRIYFDKGKDENGEDIIEAYFFNTKGCRYLSYDEVTSEFSAGSSNDFLEGRDVIYIVTADGMISTVFYLK